MICFQVSCTTLQHHPLQMIFFWISITGPKTKVAYLQTVDHDLI